MNSPAVVLTSRRVVTPEGVGPAVVHVEDGVIVHVERRRAAAPGAEVIDLGDLVLMPGLIDTHVHINEPGRTAWEGFASATRAAAAGGVTTLVDMPLNSIPSTTDVRALEAKKAAARGRVLVDVGFWGGVVPGNAPELSSLVDAGVLGFKCFLAPSGVPEFSHVGETDLALAMPILRQRGVPLLVHAEIVSAHNAAEVAGGSAQGQEAGVWRRYDRYLASRPPAFERTAIDLMIRLCRHYQTAVHIVHLAWAGALPRLAAARAEGLPLTVETCPHYLTFAAEDVPEGATQFKCAPPIREAANRERLWEGLRDGIVDLVASDHSPSPPKMKCLDTGNLRDAWGGIASLQLGLPAVWTGARARRLPVEAVSRWMSAAPARLAGISTRKGVLRAGYDADLVAWNPEASFTVDAARLYHRHALTPYAGLDLWGRVEATWVRGVRVYGREGTADTPHGRLLERDPAGGARLDDEPGSS